MLLQEENYITCLLEDGNGGCVELPAMDGEENHARKTPDTHVSVRSVNGEGKVKVKEEVERREQDDEEEEYIEVDEVNVKTEPQDCKDSKNSKQYISRQRFRSFIPPPPPPSM